MGNRQNGQMTLLDAQQGSSEPLRLGTWCCAQEWLLLCKIAVAERKWEAFFPLPSRASRADSHQPGWGNSCSVSSPWGLHAGE